MCKVRKFVRIKISVNIQEPLYLGCFIKREDESQLWIQFKYERISDLCYRFGRIDHNEVACPSTDKDSTNFQEASSFYGSWMKTQSNSKVSMNTGKREKSHVRQPKVCHVS